MALCNIFMDVDDTMCVGDWNPDVEHLFDNVKTQDTVIHVSSVGVKTVRTDVLRWRSEVIDSVREFTDSADLLWLTGWKRNAVTVLEPLWNIRSEGWLDWSVSKGERAGKLESLMKFREQSPSTPFIWCDDLATRPFLDADLDQQVFGDVPHLIIVTEQDQGLTDEHLEQMRSFISLFRL